MGKCMTMTAPVLASDSGGLVAVETARCGQIPKDFGQKEELAVPPPTLPLPTPQNNHSEKHTDHKGTDC